MRLLILLLAIFALSWSPAARAQTPSWQVSEVSGDVRLQNGDGVRAARRGVSLSPGDAVITGAGGRAVMTRGQEFVIVSPGSRLRLPGAAERPGGVVQMLQDLGTAVYRIQKKMTPHFGVQTPYLAAVVKGTTFRVVAGPQGASVQVLEGRVEVATSDGRETRMAIPGLLVAVSATQPGRLTVVNENSAGRDTARATAKADGETAKDDKENGDRANGDRANGDNRTADKDDRASRAAEPKLDNGPRGNGDADSARGPRQDGPGSDDRNGAIVTRPAGEKALLVQLPQAARNARPPGGDKPDAGPKAPTPDKAPDAPKPGKAPDAPKPDAPKPETPKPDAPKPDAPKPDAPKPDKAPEPPKPEPAKPDTDKPAPPPAPAPGGNGNGNGNDDDKDDDDDDDKDDDDSGSIGSLIASALAPLPVAAPAPPPALETAPAIDTTPAPTPVTDPAAVPPLAPFAQPVPTPPAPQPPLIAMDVALGLDRLLPTR